MLSNRLSGLFFISVGLLLYFVIIPYDTEVVDYGWVRPQTLPNAMVWIMVMAGLVIALKPEAESDFEWRKASAASLYLFILVAGVFAISRFGFVLVSPCLVLILMLLMHERRPVWLLSGVVGVPLLIWFAVTVLLGRSLPG